MTNSITQLEMIISDYTPLLYRVSEADFTSKPLPEKWSKKEILGHLVDSVQTNIRRFIIARYEEQPHIVYAQDFWVTAANYQEYNTNDLITLWALLNKHACIILKNIPAGAEKMECLTGSLHSIEWLAADYNKHLLHHLHQVLNLKPIPYP
jgi:DinB superfamily